MNNEESVTKIMIYSNDEEEPVILEGNYNKIIIDEPNQDLNYILSKHSFDNSWMFSGVAKDEILGVFKDEI